MRIGLISDTHGLLRPQASSFLSGCDHIVHAGDIGGAGVLKELAVIAPVTAVRGNNDKGEWADALAEFELVRFGEIFLFVVHDLTQIDIDPVDAGVHVVVSGHTHKPLVTERKGVVYANPGSAGRRRFKLPVSIGELMVDGTSIVPHLLELDCP
jgi:hypothetical protein